MDVFKLSKHMLIPFSMLFSYHSQPNFPVPFIRIRMQSKLNKKKLSCRIISIKLMFFRDDESINWNSRYKTSYINSFIFIKNALDINEKTVQIYATKLYTDISNEDWLIFSPRNVKNGHLQNSFKSNCVSLPNN